jgi:hypothetical protein
LNWPRDYGLAGHRLSVFQRPGHIRGNRGGDALGPFRPFSTEMGIHSAHKRRQPALEILLGQRALAMELAMNIHGVAAIGFFTQQQLAPVILDMGQVDLEIYLGYILKDRCQTRIIQDAGIEQIDKCFNMLPIVKIDIGRAIGV